MIFCIKDRQDSMTSLHSMTSFDQHCEQMQANAVIIGGIQQFLPPREISILVIWCKYSSLAKIQILKGRVMLVLI
jgi:hypothetical protein